MCLMYDSEGCAHWDHSPKRLLILASLYAVLEAELLLPCTVTWRHSKKRVLSEPLDCVGSGTDSSVGHYYRKGNVCD